MSILAKRFKYLREKNNWTQDKVAEKLGVSRPTIAGYESHEKNRIPREETLNKIADLFNTTTDYLLGRTDDPSPTRNDLPDELKDPEANIFFKDYLSAPKEKQEELKRFWEYIKQAEKGRKPGDKQGE